MSESNVPHVPLSGSELDYIIESLRDRPRSLRELRITSDVARALADRGVVVIDPDRFPDEHVPGNPMVLRLPGDERPWPGWESWNV